jgi:hypothetical protein
LAESSAFQIASPLVDLFPIESIVVANAEVWNFVAVEQAV